MASSRPKLPAETERVVLTEAGHRCAVCGEGCPLERAHIIPWCVKPSLAPEDLVCLCANCHQRADTERWGAKTLGWYKRNPWVTRRELTPDEPRRVGFTILIHGMEIAQLTPEARTVLEKSLADYLGISPDYVSLEEAEEGSVIATFLLPEEAGRRLYAQLVRHDPKVREFLSALPATLLQGAADSLLARLLGEGRRLVRRGEYRQAQEVLERAYQLAKGEVPHKSLGSISCNLGLAREGLGDMGGAIGLHQEALAHDAALGDRLAIADHHFNLARLFKYFGQMSEAKRHTQAAVKLYLQEGENERAERAREQLGHQTWDSELDDEDDRPSDAHS